MVGVFDPKSAKNSPQGGGRFKTLIAGASLAGIIAVAAGLGLTGQSGQSNTTLVAEGPTSAPETETATDFALKPIPTSFQDIAPTAQREVRREALKSRDTLTDLLDRLGVARGEANEALYALYDAELIDPRKVRPGLEVAAYVMPSPTLDDPEAVTLAGLTLKHKSEASLVVSRTAGGEFSAHELQTKLVPQVKRIVGDVQTSLYHGVLEAGANDAQVYDFAQIFAYDVDFQREMRVGDQFEIVFEQLTDERGRFVQSGDILFASLNGYATEKAFYRFTPSDDGITDYFDEEGASARKFLMKTPINGARLSSGFGFRRHPVLGYNKLHKGTDFAAPTGTPIMAAGNGVVERASRFGSFGHYIKIRHANGYQTAYAHLNGYAKGIRKGARVKQGDIIGYVGTTGRSTGPHLHYEVIQNGKHLNPMTLKLPTGRKLEGEFLEAFNQAKAEIDALRGVHQTDTLFASSGDIATGADSSSGSGSL